MPQNALHDTVWVKKRNIKVHNTKYRCIFHVIAKIQTMKNAVPKNDKKRRKQLTEDIAKLETELDQKHENELKHLQNSSSVSKMLLEDVKTPY